MAVVKAKQQAHASKLRRIVAEQNDKHRQNNFSPLPMATHTFRHGEPGVSFALLIFLCVHFDIFNPTLSATCVTSLSPRPDRFTMMIWCFHPGRALHDLGHGVGAFQRGDDAFQPRQFHEGFQGCVVFGTAGTLVQLPGVRPNALALSPDSRLLVTSGLKRELLVMDPANGAILQNVPMPTNSVASPLEAVSPLFLKANLKDKLSFTGLAFSPDGRRIYLSNVNGDIKVFEVGNDHKVTPLFAIPLPPANMPDRKEDIPAGFAVSRDGKRIYVALNVANRLVEIDTTTGKLWRTWDVGVAPYAVVLAGKKIYVSNWGGRRPDTNSVVGPIGRNGIVRVDARSIASEGSVSIIDLDSESTSPSVQLVTGLHACALALSPNGKYVVCANAGSDTLSVIDVHTERIVETICARQNPGDLFGAQPSALVFDKHGKSLFVCNGSQNAVAMFQFQPGNSKLLGLIPVGWFPGAIAYDPQRHRTRRGQYRQCCLEERASCQGQGRRRGF